MEGGSARWRHPLPPKKGGPPFLGGEKGGRGEEVGWGGREGVDYSSSRK